MLQKLILVMVIALTQPAEAEVFSIVDWNGVKALKLTGAIEAGTTSRFNAIADLAEPSAHGFPILLLDSPGGSVMEALMLSAALQNKPFHTVIPDGASCASA